ncbi:MULTISPECIES: hypothetical protein [Acinetobacter]|uniref:hypothetical protein n=1 Tax=Acinetobacter TaxID=469 RepID=UPI001CE3FE00|nr:MULTISPECIES: hypothetical protein [Acinetobacter]MCI3877701.1 hypothetical protein [Acinetobacter higginsii]
MKKLVIGLLAVIIVVFGYMYKSSKEKSERLAKEAVEYQQKIESEKAKAEQEKQAELAHKQQKAILDSDIKNLQQKYSMDYAEAKKIIESTPITDVDKKFYAELASKWSDAIKVASSTSRIALSQPVKNMQDVKRSLVEKQTSTYCETKMKEELIKSYDYAIDGFLQFMQKNELVSDVFLQASNEFQKRAIALIDYC